MSLSWESLRDDARTMPHEDRERRLVTICLAFCFTVVSTSNAAVGLGQGRPPMALVRECAAELLATSKDTGPRIIGTMFAHRAPNRKKLDEATYRVDVEEALRLARGVADPHVLAWVHMSAAYQYTLAQRISLANQHAEAAATTIGAATSAGLGPYAWERPGGERPRTPSWPQRF